MDNSVSRCRAFSFASFHGYAAASHTLLTLHFTEMVFFNSFRSIIYCHLEKRLSGDLLLEYLADVESVLIGRHRAEECPLCSIMIPLVYTDVNDHVPKITGYNVYGSCLRLTAQFMSFVMWDLHLVVLLGSINLKFDHCKGQVFVLSYDRNLRNSIAELIN